MLKNRKLNRCKYWNYSQPGYYFITMCVQNFIKIFGDVVNKKMILNEYGKIADNCFSNIPKYYKNIKIDKFVIMPNHVHGIIKINANVGTEQCGTNVGTEQCSVPTTKCIIKNYGLLSKIIMSYKNITTKKIHKQLNDYSFKWQRSFHDRVIRDKHELYIKKCYIINNPKK